MEGLSHEDGFFSIKKKSKMACVVRLSNKKHFFLNQKKAIFCTK